MVLELGCANAGGEQTRPTAQNQEIVHRLLKVDAHPGEPRAARDPMPQFSSCAAAAARTLPNTIPSCRSSPYVQDAYPGAARQLKNFRPGAQTPSHGPGHPGPSLACGSFIFAVPLYVRRSWFPPARRPDPGKVPTLTGANLLGAHTEIPARAAACVTGVSATAGGLVVHAVRGRDAACAQAHDQGDGSGHRLEHKAQDKTPVTFPQSRGRRPDRSTLRRRRVTQPCIGCRA
jgi:hypothetical protein